MDVFFEFQQRLAALRGDRRGAVAAIAGLTMVGLVGLSAVVVDVGSALVVRRNMQAAADAAALSGAGALASAGPNGAKTVAASYSGQSGGQNAVGGVPVQSVSGYPMTRCLTSIGVSCVGSPASNAVVVSQTASVPTYFTKLFGFSAINVNVTSTAAIAGGVTKPVEVLIVLDSTASMNDNDPACGMTKMNCALGGARSLVSGMAPSSTKVGLMTYPPTTAATAARTYDCNNGTNQAVVAYNNPSASYDLLPLGSDFRTADDSPMVNGTNLNQNSNAVKAFGGRSGCAGMKAIGGVGTYFAEAVRRAQTTLAGTGSVDTQKVIIVLSDGDATASSSNISGAQFNDQCQQAVDAAAAAKAAGTWVYTVAYNASTSSTGSCANDTPRISACNTMKNMAFDASKFFSTSTSGCTSPGNSTTSLNQIFSSIGQTFRGTRLVPNSTT